MNQGVQFHQPFDSSQVQPTQPGGVIMQEGWAVVAITASEAVPTSNNSGVMTVFDVTAQAGPDQGKTHKDRLNLNNPSPQAVEIAYKTLSAYTRAVGKVRIQNSAELHGVPFLVRFGTESGESKPDPMTGQVKTYPPKSRIYEFATIQGASVIDGKPIPGALEYLRSLGGGQVAPPAPQHGGGYPQQPAGYPAQGGFPNNAAPAPGAYPQPPAPQPAAQPVYQMTPKANGYTREQMHGGGWTDDALIRDGYMVAQQPAAPAPPPPQPSAPPPAAYGGPQPGHGAPPPNAGYPPQPQHQQAGVMPPPHAGVPGAPPPGAYPQPGAPAPGGYPQPTPGGFPQSPAPASAPPGAPSAMPGWMGGQPGQ